jgi:hypothetical protein
MTAIALHAIHDDFRAETNPVAGSIASWHALATAIRIGYFDLLAAGRAVSDPATAKTVLRLAEEVGAAADSLERFVADCWGYRPPIDRGPAGTCQTIMKRLQARFGDRAVLMEAESYHRTVLEQLDVLANSVESRFRPHLSRRRDVLVSVLDVLQSLSAGREYPARSAAS